MAQGARGNSGNIGRYLTALAGSIAAATAVAISVAYFLTAHHYEAQRIQDEVDHAAEEVSRFVYAAPNTWRFQDERIAESLSDHLVDRPGPRSSRGSYQYRIFAPHGGLLFVVGEPPPPPAITRRSEIRDGFRPVARIELTQGVRHIWTRGMLAIVIGLALAAAVFVVLRLLPLRALQRRDEALHASEEQLRLITDAMPVLIAYVDAEERYRFVNRTGEAWYRRASEQIIGQRVRDVIEPSAYRHLRPLLDGVMCGVEINEERTIPYPDGTARAIRVNYLPHFDHAGRVQGFFALAEDITAQKETEEQLRHAQKMEAVGNLTGGVAHDFNNLLGVVLGNLELLGDRLRDQPDALRLAETAIKATMRGAELTQRLLAYSRKQALDPQMVDITQLMPHTIELLRRVLVESIRVETALPAGLWPALVDPGQLETAILNLTINARDAMPEGGTLTVEARNTTLDAEYAAQHPDVIPGEYLMIAVTDTGTGMPPDVIARAFDPFFTTKDVGKGSGLGLSMVYGFVKQSGGHVSIYSEQGYGTSVRLYLPRAKEAGTSADEPLAQRPDNPTGTETILVVEDDPNLRYLATTVLRGLGYTVLEAGDGQSALSALTAAPHVDLVFSDVVLPGGMHGVELVQAARRSRPDLKVLLATGYAEDAILHRLESTERFDVLHKPYRRSELAGTVRELLDAPSERSATVAAHLQLRA